MMMTAFIPNAYSLTYNTYSPDTTRTYSPDTEERAVEAAGGVTIATSVNGSTIRVKMNNLGASLEGQTVTINRCWGNGGCQHLGASEIHWVEYLDEQKSDEYAKAAGSTAALAVPAFVVGRVVFGTFATLKTIITRYWVPNTTFLKVAPYGLGVIAGAGSAALVEGMTFDTLNPVHHYDVAEALGAALDSDTVRNKYDQLSGKDFEELVEDLDEGLRSAVD